MSALRLLLLLVLCVPAVAEASLTGSVGWRQSFEAGGGLDFRLGAGIPVGPVRLSLAAAWSNDHSFSEKAQRLAARQTLWLTVHRQLFGPVGVGFGGGLGRVKVPESGERESSQGLHEQLEIRLANGDSARGYLIFEGQHHWQPTLFASPEHALVVRLQLRVL